MQDADKGQSGTLDGQGLTIGIVRARFNDAITGKLAECCLAELAACGVNAEDIQQVTVPGALEVPLALQALADSDDYDALIALGCIIRGETYHFELVSNESAAGITRVGLDFNIAIANGILTTDTDAQAHARTREKGRDCARAAVEMANLTSDLDGLQDHGQDEENE